MTWRFNNKRRGSCSAEAALAPLKFCAFIQGSGDDLANLDLPSLAVELSATGVKMLPFRWSPEGVPVTHRSCHSDLKLLCYEKSPCAILS